MGRGWDTPGQSLFLHVNEETSPSRIPEVCSNALFGEDILLAFSTLSLELCTLAYFIIIITANVKN